MVTRIDWIERKFNFDFPITVFPLLLERLRGTPIILAHKISRLSHEALTTQVDGKWSILENIGHLIEVERLHDHRLDQYVEGVEELVMADMSNQATEKADYNAQDPRDVLAGFENVRKAMIDRLESFDDALVARSAFHPRLKKPMRVVDMVLFTAEHDDQHLAMIEELVRRIG